MAKKNKTPQERFAQAARDALAAGEHLGGLTMMLQGAQREREQQEDAAAEQAGKHEVTLVCPNCGDNDRLGTNETIPGTAFATFTRSASGRIDVDHMGETDVSWDGAESHGWFCGQCCAEGENDRELVTVEEYAERQAIEAMGTALLQAIKDASSEELDADGIEDVAGRVVNGARRCWDTVA